MYQKVNIFLVVLVVLLILASFCPLIRHPFTRSDTIKLYGDFLLLTVIFFNMLAYQILKRVEVSYRIRLRYSLVTVTSTVILLGLVSYFSRVLDLVGDFGYIDVFLIENIAFGLYFWKMLFEKCEKYIPVKAADGQNPGKRRFIEYRAILALLIIIFIYTALIFSAEIIAVGKGRLSAAKAQIYSLHITVNDFKTTADDTRPSRKA